MEHFTEHGIKFDDGSQIEADVIFATGYCLISFCLLLTALLIHWFMNTRYGDQLGNVADKGEISGVCRDNGVRGLWYMMGTFSF
jgi:hypothetical protein